MSDNSIYNIVFDYGNTFKKIAIFQINELKYLKIYRNHKIQNVVNYLEKLNIKGNTIVSSVIDFPEKLEQYLKENYKYFNFTHYTPLPIKNKYLTVETLGKDRLAAAVAANNMFPNNNLLIINAGSCLTYDFVNNLNEYHGGGISPGLSMRFKSLYNFTKKLPLIKINSIETNKQQNIKLTGDTTEDSILSGVLNGIIAEVEGIILQYKLQYPDLKVVFSGGDVNFFEKRLKSSIFAVPNLVLNGLNIILNYNNVK